MTLLAIAMMSVSASSFATDYSSFYFTAGSNIYPEGDPTSFVGITLIDSQGRRTGSNPTLSGAGIAEMPGFGPGSEAIGSDTSSGTTPDELGAQSIIIGGGPVPTGVYTLVVFSTVSYAVPYGLDLSFRASTGYEQPNSGIEINSILPVGTTATYTINYNPAPGSAVTVVKTVTFAVLRQELQAAFDLHQIGDHKFVEHLDKILAQGEKALAPKPEEKREAGKAQEHKQGREKPNKKKAIEKLKEFIHQLHEAAQAKPEKEREAKQAQKHKRGDHEREGEPKRFVTAVALKSLTDDAKTLIRDLEGEPKHEH